MESSGLSFVILLALGCATILTEGAETITAEKSSNLTKTVENSYLPPYNSFSNSFGELSLKSNLGQALIVGGTVIAGAVILGGLALLLAPLLGIKLCHLMGNCESGLPYQANGGASPNSYNEVYGAYVPATAYSSYQKRSLDYVGPILKTLAAAYEKYDGRMQNSAKQALKKE